MSKLSRRDARICADKVIFSVDFYKEEDKDALFERTCENSAIASNDFAKSLFLGACENLEKIDAAISENSKGWKIERISKMSLAVMRIASYELLFTDTPTPIVINEAIEIDKLFDGDDAPAFVNGILNAVAKSERKHE